MGILNINNYKQLYELNSTLRYINCNKKQCEFSKLFFPNY